MPSLGLFPSVSLISYLLIYLFLFYLTSFYSYPLETKRGGSGKKKRVTGLGVAVGMFRRKIHSQYIVRKMSTFNKKYMNISVYTSIRPHIHINNFSFEVRNKYILYGNSCEFLKRRRL